MRLISAALFFVLTGPAIALAQSRAPEPGQPLPPSSIGLPLPTIGLPHPPMGLPAVTQPEPPREVDRPGKGRRRHGSGHRHPGGYLLPVLVWPVPVLVGGATPEGRPQQAQVPVHDETGWLRLMLEADADTQVFVDGIYKGLIDEVSAGVELDPGVHTLELRAAGYEPHTIAVSIGPGRVTRYRAALTPVGVDPEAKRPGAAPASTREGVRRTPTTFYEIPGCYLGDVPPTPADLPAGCDVARMRTVTR